MNNSKSHELGELRQDPITEKWVAIATNRAKRPDQFASEQAQPDHSIHYADDCPFCNAEEFPQSPDILRLPDDPETWQVHIFENKYPAFRPKEEFRAWNVGPYRATESVGYHELLVTRWHNQCDALVSPEFLALELEALILRYRQLKVKPSVNYIQIIKNHGERAGASLPHPHNQIFTVPILPSDLQDLLLGTERFAHKNGEKAFSIILEYEKKERTRIVYENEYFTALCPYASRVPFETWILPNESNPFFDTIGPQEREALAEAMREILGRLYTGLNDPPYNYYIHSAPCDDTGFVCDIETFKHFRWHVAILPRLSTWAGFELGTGLEINVVAPEDAAEFLREQKAPIPL